MINVKHKEECCGCFACINICSKDCIKMRCDEEGFLYPIVDKEKCIKCGLCDKVCPTKNELGINIRKNKAYACKNIDNEIRQKSSSGGVFSLLCEQVIKKGGVVFGAAFDENFEVRHMYAESLDECAKFRNSKYVQSLIGKSYKEAKAFLDSGRVVLFSATQCQIKGLNLYLKRKYDNLFTVDIICHGVPSPLVFKIYNESLKKKFKSEISEINFRDKNGGWKNYNYTVKFSNGDSFSESFTENIYMRGFLKDLYLRPSCYKCKAKKNKSGSDISLADYWGVENKHPEFDDNKGTSLILVNSLKGEKMISEIKRTVDIISTDLEYAIKHNPCIDEPVNYNKRRNKFFKEIKHNDLDSAISKSYKITLMDKFKNKIIYEIQKNRKKIRREEKV